MRVLFLCNSTSWGGAERYVQAVADALTRRGHEIFAAMPPRSPLFARLSATTAVIPLPLDLGPKLGTRTAIDLVLRWPLYLRRLMRWIREHREALHIDLLHVQFKKEQLLATTVAARLGLPTIWTEHGALPEPIVKVLPALWIYRRMAGKTSAIICVSEAVKRDLSHQGISSSLLRVCRNGIEVSELPTPSDRQIRREKARATLGFRRDQLLIAAIGRLSWVKGLHYLIEAVPAIVRRVDRAHLVIVGDGPELTRLKKLATACGIADRITFTGHRDDIREVLAAIDVVAMPSLHEGMPFAALEAMDAGVPVVASRVGALPDLLAEGRAGMLVQPGDVRALAACLCELLINEQGRVRLANAARARLVDRYSFDGMIDCSEAVMQECILKAEVRSRP